MSVRVDLQLRWWTGNKSEHQLRIEAQLFITNNNEVRWQLNMLLFPDQFMCPYNRPFIQISLLQRRGMTRSVSACTTEPSGPRKNSKDMKNPRRDDVSPPTTTTTQMNPPSSSFMTRGFSLVTRQQITGTQTWCFRTHSEVLTLTLETQTYFLRNLLACRRRTSWAWTFPLKNFKNVCGSDRTHSRVPHR